MFFYVLDVLDDQFVTLEVVGRGGAEMRAGRTSTIADAHWAA
jgi:hypothetical protein